MEVTDKLKKLMDKYSIEIEDLVFCELINAGWGKYEAMFSAYHLAYFDRGKMNIWIRERKAAYPGIDKLIIDNDTRERESAKELRELKEKLKEKRKRGSSTTTADPDADPDKMSKEELGKMYVRIMRDSSTDDKTKMDAAKSYSSLYQLQKEQEEEENNNINFFLPPGCHYCDRCKNCKLKGELEARGCKIRAKKTSPYLWEIVKPGEDEDQFVDSVISEDTKNQ